MGKARASIFEDSTEDEIDISSFAPKSAAAAAAGPAPADVRAVSEAANFRSREAPPQSTAKPRREPRRYRTGRNVQFNVKALQETVDRFYAICDKQDWVMGYTLERAITALERELKES